MAGSVLTRTVDKPIHFQEGAGFTLDGKLESVRLFLPDEGGREIVLVTWFDYWTFKRIDRSHHFGYTPESIDREGDLNYEFVSTLPMQIELRAEGAAAAALASLDGEALLDAAVAALTGDDKSSPLLDVASYKYLAVYQSKGAYMSGFTSVYKKQKT